MKIDTISKLFEEGLKPEDLKNDNEQELTNDIKVYNKIDKNRMDDVIRFEAVTPF